MTTNVLILSPPEDDTAELISDELARRERANVLWFDVADFPLRVTVNVEGPPWVGQLITPGGAVDLEKIDAVVYRRPTQYQMPETMSDTNRRFAVGEARIGLGGILSGLPCRWINHPARVADAEFKPVQLQVAAAMGLEAPHTLFTNDPARARRFASDLPHGVIYKTMTGFDVEKAGESLLVYTSVVEPAHIDDSVRTTMHQFQEQVPKAYDLRITVVDERCFAVAIDCASPRSRLDFRADYSGVSYRPVELAGALQVQLRRYLDHFGLTFGAFDFVVTPEGRTIFLECNPNGQWGWIQEETGLPIAEAMADYLMGC